MADLKRNIELGVSLDGEKKVTEELKKIDTSIKKVGDATKKTTNATKELERGLSRGRLVANSFGTAFNNLGSVFKSILAPLSAIIGYLTFNSLISGLTKLDALRTRINSVLGDTENFNNVFEKLRQVAIRTNTSLDATVATFTGLRQNLGLTTQETLSFQEQLNKLALIGGTATESASAGIYQLQQALASGRLQGDELRSILENLPAVAKALATKLNVGIGDLRNLGAEGKLTTGVVLSAINEADTTKASELSNTLSGSFNRLSIEFQNLILSADKALGASNLISAAINLLGDALKSLSIWFTNNATRAKAYITVLGTLGASWLVGVSAIALFNGAFAKFILQIKAGAASLNLGSVANKAKSATGGLIMAGLLGGGLGSVAAQSVATVSGAVGKIGQVFTKIGGLLRIIGSVVAVAVRAIPWVGAIISVVILLYEFWDTITGFFSKIMSKAEKLLGLRGGTLGGEKNYNYLDEDLNEDEISRRKSQSQKPTATTKFENVDVDKQKKQLENYQQYLNSVRDEKDAFIKDEYSKEDVRWTKLKEKLKSEYTEGLLSVGQYLDLLKKAEEVHKLNMEKIAADRWQAEFDIIKEAHDKVLQEQAEWHAKQQEAEKKFNEEMLALQQSQADTEKQLNQLLLENVDTSLSDRLSLVKESHEKELDLIRSKYAEQAKLQEEAYRQNLISEQQFDAINDQIATNRAIEERLFLQTKQNENARISQEYAIQARNAKLNEYDVQRADAEIEYQRQLTDIQIRQQVLGSLYKQGDLDQLNAKIAFDAKINEIETARTNAQVSAVSTMFGDLADIAKLGGNKFLGIYKALKIAELSMSLITDPLQIYTKTSALFGAPFGPILGGIAAGIATAKITAGIQQVSNLKGFASGGIVGQAGSNFIAQSDKVPAMLTKGELVVNSRQQTNLLNEIMNGGSMGGNAKNINVTTKLMLDGRQLASAVAKANLENA